MKVFSIDDDWDCLIILDACRYDYFANLYKRFFDGVLEKRFSLGVDTPSWCRNTFTKHYGDVVYISGNPYINSKMCVNGCCAGAKFFKVVDAWDLCWDNELGTVPPWKLVSVTLKYLERFRGKRFIIHYLQPHAPYIIDRFRGIGFPKPTLDRGEALAGINNGRRYNRRIYEKFAYIIANLAVKLRLAPHPWLVLERLEVPPVSPMDTIRRYYGVSILREAYKENLEIALEFVAVLVDKILRINPYAKIIITSDHGEMLGENGLFSHGIDHPFVRIVPWFKVNAVKIVPRNAGRKVIELVLRDRIKNIIRERLT